MIGSRILQPYIELMYKEPFYTTISINIICVAGCNLRATGDNPDTAHLVNGKVLSISKKYPTPKKITRRFK